MRRPCLPGNSGLGLHGPLRRWLSGRRHKRRVFKYTASCPHVACFGYVFKFICIGVFLDAVNGSLGELRWTPEPQQLQGEKNHCMLLFPLTLERLCRAGNAEEVRPRGRPSATAAMPSWNTPLRALLHFLRSYGPRARDPTRIPEPPGWAVFWLTLDSGASMRPCNWVRPRAPGTTALCTPLWHGFEKMARLF